MDGPPSWSTASRFAIHYCGYRLHRFDLFGSNAAPPDNAGDDQEATDSANTTATEGADDEAKGLSDRQADYLNPSKEHNVNEVINRELEDEDDAKGESEEAESAIILEKSCFCLGRFNPVRATCLLICENCIFEQVIFICIVYSTVLLAMDTPWQPSSLVTDIVAVSDIVLLVIFTLE